MKLWVFGFALTSSAWSIERADELDREADKLCNEHYRDFHGIHDMNLISNEQINAGNQGNVSNHEFS